MILAFKLSDIVTVPFGFLLNLLYQLTNNYGLALILFAVLVKVILLPISAKGKKSTMKMSRLTPRMQEIQKKYADDPVRQNKAIQDMYREEGVSMGGGCLWSFVPLLILIPLFTIIRQPITYMLQEGADVAGQIVNVIKEAAPSAFGNPYYDQINAAPLIPQFAEQLKAAIPGIRPETLAGIDFTFLGINLGTNPQFNIFGSAWVWNWAHIGAFLIPVLSAASQVLSMMVTQKMNNSVVTNDKGVQDKEAAAQSQSAQTTKIMMWMMPVMSLWIGFSYPSGLSLYWFIQGIVTIAIDAYLTQRYRKIYDAEDAIRLQRAMEEEAIEAEKERVRAERRAANPEGITSNTSKKKLQQRQREEQEAAKTAAAREYAAKKGIEEKEKSDEKQTLSGISDRPYCKGRAYDPKRYHSTEE